MKRLFLATCLISTLGVLGVMAGPAGAFTAHPLSPSVRAKLSHHSGRAHRLSAAQLRKDKAGAVALLRGLKSHRAHSAQVFYAGSDWSDGLNNFDLTDETGGSGYNDCNAPYGPGAAGDAENYCYFYDSFTGTGNNCDMVTSFTFTYGLYSCIYVRQDYYEDTSNGEFYGIQLLCGTYYPGQESDTASEGCQYADTYSIEPPNSDVQYGLFTYEN